MNPPSLEKNNSIVSTSSKTSDYKNAEAALRLKTAATSAGTDQRFSVGNTTVIEDEDNLNINKSKGPSKFSLHRNREGQDFDLDREPRWAFEDEKFLEYPSETEMLKILVVTWNTYGEKPGDVVEQLLNLSKTDHHIIAIATQECMRSIFASMFNDSKAEWTVMLTGALGEKYEVIKEHSLNAIHLIVFARKHLVPSIKNIESADVRTGFANVLANKGAVGISFKIRGNSFLFTSAHLTAGQDEAEKRTTDFERIISTMPLSKMQQQQQQQSNGKQLNVQDCFDYVFFAGDLNYRIDAKDQQTQDFLNEKNYQALLSNDQLAQEKVKEDSVFKGFEEGEINFAPTYKFELFSQEINTSKKRPSAWTDRILYSNSNKEARLEQRSYDSNRKVFGSDHRPVFAQFSLSGLPLLEEKESKVSVSNLSWMYPTFGLLIAVLLPHILVVLYRHLRKAAHNIDG
jgi:phosphatidylinositol-bisphosphatase/inositol-1,4,5-trisphosphate 5-phosphatase